MSQLAIDTTQMLDVVGTSDSNTYTAVASGTDVSVDVSSTEGKKKKTRKPRKKEDSTEGSDGAVVGEKPKKGRAKKIVATDGSDVKVNESDETKPKKTRKRKATTDAGDDSSSSSATTSDATAGSEGKKKAKRVRTKKATLEETDETKGEEKKEKKPRKNKAKKAEEKTAEPDASSVGAEGEQKGKKKRKTKKEKKNKSAPKKPASAFLLFSKDYRVILHQKNPKMTFSEKSKQTAHAWKHELKPEEKAVYNSRAKEGQNAYQQKMDAIPKAPKRPKNAFMMFSMERRPEVSAANKSKPKNQQLKMGDIQKILGGQWKKMTTEEKLPYQVMVTKDKERYQVQLAAFKELVKTSEAAVDADTTAIKS